MTVPAQPPLRDEPARDATAARLARLQQASLALAAATTIDGVVSATVEVGLSQLGAVAGGVFAIDPVRSLVELVGSAGYPAELVQRWTHLPLDADSPVSHAAAAGTRVVFADAAERDRLFPSLAGFPTVGTAFVAEPLRDGETVVGVLVASFADGAVALDETSREFFDSVVAQCGLALNRARTLELERAARREAVRTARRLQRLQQFTARIIDAIDPQSIMPGVLQAAVEESGASHALLAIVAGDRLRVAHTHGLERDVATQWTDFPLDARYPAGDAVLRRSPVVLATVAERDERYPELAALPDRGEHALVCLPLIASERPLGVLTLSFPGELGLDGGELPFLQALADHSAQAIERARLLEAEQRSREHLELLAEAGRLFAAETDAARLAEQLCGLAVRRIADIATLFEVDGGAVRPVAVAHASADVGPVHRALLAAMPEVAVEALWEVAGSGVPRLMPRSAPEGLGELDDVQRSMLRSLDIGSSLLLPLRVHGRPVGVLSLATLGARRPLDEADLSQMAELAGRVALALDNAEMFRQHEQVALELQRSLLPEQLTVPQGTTVAARYLAGTRGMSIGGDFYDVIPLPTGRYALVVGDVMGRGVRAAAVMGQLRAAVRGYALEGHAPAELLARLDRLVCGLDEGLIVTCVYGEWDPQRAVVTLAAAGHPPPLLRRPDGGVEVVALDPGLPLGVGAGTFRERELELAPLALLLLYTDGLVEGPERPVDEGVSWLAESIRDAEDPEQACRRAVDRMTRDPRLGDDDVAVLAVQVQASPPASGATDNREQVTVELPADAQSPARARAEVRAALTRWDRGAHADVAMLLVSELVTNAVRHAGTALVLRLLALPGRIRCEVCDHAPAATPMVASTADSAAEGGRGLFLVARFASRWGTEVTEQTKTVWFELDG